MPRNVCFVTGTRAEFGLMSRTLRAISSHRKLRLQVVVTGMHLDRKRGRSRRLIAEDGWQIDRVVPWNSSDDPSAVARATGAAITGLSRAFDDLRSDIVLVVGDRVEAFAAASAAHISGRAVAHVHGGDRALGIVDDSLRHAITKLAHIHFPATRSSAQRIMRLGEDRGRVHLVGSPGIDGIRGDALRPSRGGADLGRFALLVLHPVDADARVEERRARLVLTATRRAGVDRIVIVYPNNDPGSAGIVRAWQKSARDEDIVIYRNLARGNYLGLLKHAAALVGNSSSGIIEAASFGVPVVDVGPRQQGRERGANVVNVRYSAAAIESALRRALRRRRLSNRNTYGGSESSHKIAHTLASIKLDANLTRKLISY